jgi:hypothetical protein
MELTNNDVPLMDMSFSDLRDAIFNLTTPLTDEKITIIDVTNGKVTVFNTKKPKGNNLEKIKVYHIIARYYSRYHNKRMDDLFYIDPDNYVSKKEAIIADYMVYASYNIYQDNGGSDMMRFVHRLLDSISINTPISISDLKYALNWIDSEISRLKYVQDNSEIQTNWDYGGGAGKSGRPIMEDGKFVGNSDGSKSYASSKQLRAVKNSLKPMIDNLVSIRDVFNNRILSETSNLSL